MFRSFSIAAVVAVLGLAACAPEASAPPAPKPSDGFPVADRAFVDGAAQVIAQDLGASVIFRDLAISDTPGQGKSLCGDAALPGEAWKGIVVRKGEAAGDFLVLIADDNLSPRALPQCRKLVLKYLGETKVDWYEAETAMNQAGCAHIDVNYWTGWKDYCQGAQTRSAKTQS
ncbi:hypothetical protein DDF62_07445 [Caulobacter radicis]|uniref:hypothetical protein n=1 Tax=Caulobacter radicis TaxID=2172650 RepID=UPI000D585F56|nr:hypothetical protein [Caulobacter radicis]PVM91199.1 hypothetical protein DDF62_07445 [Caulobacter radicis]